jgi:hypothetical protein
VAYEVATPTLSIWILPCFFKMILQRKMALLKGVLADKRYTFDYSTLFPYGFLLVVELILLKI